MLQERTGTEHGEPCPQGGVVERAIFEVLLARNMRPGDSVNIILAQYETERRGIDRSAFSVAVVRLLDRGLLRMRGNLFCLTDAGFITLRRDRASVTPYSNPPE